MIEYVFDFYFNNLFYIEIYFFTAIKGIIGYKVLHFNVRV